MALTRIQQAAAVLVLLLLVFAYARAREIPFAIPISLLHGDRPGGWGYDATLAGLSAIVLVGCWQACAGGAWILGLPLAGALVLIGALACYPFPSAPHEPVAMTLAVLGVVWMFARVAGSAAPWRRAGPWIGLAGLPLLATACNRPAAVGEALLLLALAAVAGAAPEAATAAPGGGLREAWAGGVRLLAPILRLPGLGWGLVSLLAAQVTGVIDHEPLLSPLILGAAWASGWVIRRWDPGVLVSVTLRVGPLLLLASVGPGGSGAVFAGFVVLAGGTMVLARMMAVLAE